MTMNTSNRLTLISVAVATILISACGESDLPDQHVAELEAARIALSDQPAPDAGVEEPTEQPALGGASGEPTDQPGSGSDSEEIIGQSTLGASAAGLDLDEFDLVFHEEFVGSVVDATKWSTVLPWGSDFVINGELQYYVDTQTNPDFGYDPFVFDGTALTLTASPTPAGYEERANDQSWLSGVLSSHEKFAFTHGYIEARVDVPAGQGLWPAFWMLGENINVVSWPQCGEIDIMEHVNTEMSIHGTAHWNNGGHVYQGGSAIVNPSNYQVYTIEWNDTEILWFLNGVEFYSLSVLNNTQSTEEFHLPFYLILNLAIGGNWPGNPDATTPFPAQVEVDYVRAYKLDAEASSPELEKAEFALYPNPAIDQLTIESSMDGMAQITALNGAFISEQKITSGATSLSVENLENGMYMISVQYANGSMSTTKFIKE